MSDIQYHAQQEGWTHKFSPDGHCIYFHRPEAIGGGFVTVDFSTRIFNIGMAKPYRHAGTNTYKGRDWKNKIIADAIAHLEKIMTSN